MSVPKVPPLSVPPSAGDRPKLLDRRRAAIRLRHYSLRTAEACERKVPLATTDRRWHWVFPSNTISVDPRTGWRGRHHLHEGTVSHEITRASGQG